MLVVGDDGAAGDVAAKLHHYSDTAFEISQAARLEEAPALLQEDALDLLLLDFTSEADGGGLETLARAQVAASRFPIIALAETDEMSNSLQALRLGAQDYLAKDQLDAHVLARSIHHALERTDC